MMGGGGGLRMRKILRSDFLTLERYTGGGGEEGVAQSAFGLCHIQVRAISSNMNQANTTHPSSTRFGY